jgi:cell division protein FtsB
MPTRLKRPAIWRPLALSVGLVAFQAYLGYNAWRGQFGIESNHEMLGEIEDLRAQTASLQAEIDAYRHRVDLFNPRKLDPDILTERARALLNMATPGDILVMVDPATGLPVLGTEPALDSGGLSSIITGSIAQ